MRRNSAVERGGLAEGGPGFRGVGSGTWIGRSGGLAKGPEQAKSIEPGQEGGRDESGRGALIVVALLVVTGLLWLWIGSGERGGGPRVEPGPRLPPVRAAGAEELVPAAPPPTAARSEGASELEPFLAGRVPPRRFEGKVGTLRGHVEVEGEEPMPRVWRLVARPSNTLPAREFAVTRALEFDDGRADFELRDLPLGGYDVLGEAEGFNGQALPVLLEPGNEHPFVNLHIVPAGRLEGRVLDATGGPAEGITLTLFAVEDNAAREARTDASGTFRFDRLPDGAYEILVGKATSPLIPERRPLRFQAPHMTFPDIELPLLGALNVRVVDTLERPIEGVEVLGSGTNGGIVEGRTDYDGRLEARYLPAGRFRLRFSHPEYDEERRIAVDVKAGEVAEVSTALVH